MAIELVVRMRRVGVPVPETIASGLLKTEPALLMFSESGKELAERVIQLIEVSEQNRLSASTKQRLSEYLNAFENLGKTSVGKQAEYLLRSYFGSDWRGQMTRIHRGISASKEGTEYTVPSSLQMLEEELIAYMARKERNQ